MTWTVGKIAGTVADIALTGQMLDLSAGYETFRTIEEIGPTPRGGDPDLRR